MIANETMEDVMGPKIGSTEWFWMVLVQNPGWDPKSGQFQDCEQF